MIEYNEVENFTVKVEQIKNTLDMVSEAISDDAAVLSKTDPMAGDSLGRYVSILNFLGCNLYDLIEQMNSTVDACLAQRRAAKA